MKNFLKKLSHVSFFTSKLKETIEFYCKLIGCRVVHEFKNKNGDVYGVFLYANNGTFIEFFYKETVSREKSNFDHICFEVEDIEKIGEKFETNGYAVQIKRGKTDNVLQFFVDDPNNIKIEFHQHDKQSKFYKLLAK